MECTIDGNYYNTHLDTEVVHWGDGRAKSDPRHVLSVLYRTRDGAWYKLVRCGTNEDIKPMTAERVQELLQEKHLDYVLVRYFAEPVKKPQAVSTL